MMRSEAIDAVTGASTVAVWDLDADTYTVTVDGIVTEQRPLTADERAQLEGHEEGVTAATNTTQLVDDSDEAVDKLVAVVDALNAITALSNATINQNPAAVIKDLARECKTIARQANREARLTSGRTESTDTGEIVDT